MTKNWEGIQPPVDINQRSLQHGSHDNLYGSYDPFPPQLAQEDIVFHRLQLKVESHYNFFSFLPSICIQNRDFGQTSSDNIEW